MRITCPNCLAQYEIDATLLPQEGREVQCSACDTIWFQTMSTRKAPKPVAQVLPDPQPQMPPIVDIDASMGTDTDPAPPDDKAPEPEPAAPTPPSPAPRARSLDPSVTEVLRQEAEFEAAQRKRDAEPVETQPDLGLLGGSPWPAFRDPDDDTVNDTKPPEQDTATLSSFPDIDDVSASLDPIDASRASDTGGYDLPLTAKDRQRSFFQGFIIPLALGGLVVGLYLAAPLLSALIPPAAPVLSEYTDAINTMRMNLAQMLLGQ